MITGFLASVGINLAYDLIKTSTIHILKGNSSQLIDNIYDCIDCSAKEFFEHFGTKYGKPTDSFLARQEIYDVIVRQMFYSEQSLLKDKLNKSGYDGISTDDEAIDYFIECLLNEMKKDFELNKIITVKESIKKISEIHDFVSNDKANDKGKNFTIRYPDGKQIPCEKGDTYHKKFDNGLEQKMMIDENGYHVESKDIYDRVTYCDINFEGQINYVKFPYELSEYKLIIPNEQVIKQYQYKIPNGHGVVYEFKWGKKVIAEFNSLWKLTGLRAEVKSCTDSNLKEILIMPEDEEKEKIHEL